mmetsp:Transcript_5416/g.8307  ORF Transcript_5416/g.8307 Transcript_5416/m.8307 type:complete len:496 (+) Transcript_5416:75-1562(+)|eukprot:CAMPEP_0178906666 /NCGR_PEP_ID=MMETSP0786-20121207/6949_1 /TAXON_ID=186022 /ORGANISM="Thalassionema frauenfeldii, Strain CCMP 1798" /LENGTH=495 /DNA_ID=CAMNT_0020578393 /DNA_START=53 /DNA_END=1540 /DNA_ORIENTATION=+
MMQLIVLLLILLTKDLTAWLTNHHKVVRWKLHSNLLHFIQEKEDIDRKSRFWEAPEIQPPPVVEPDGNPETAAAVTFMNEQPPDTKINDAEEDEEVDDNNDTAVTCMNNEMQPQSLVTSLEDEQEQDTQSLLEEQQEEAEITQETLAASFDEESQSPSSSSDAETQTTTKDDFPAYSSEPATVWSTLNDRFVMKEYEGVSAKCRVYEAQLKDPETGEPYGEECIIKVSNLHQLMRKEAENYYALQEQSQANLFIQVYEYHEPVTENDVSAIIMEKGHIDIYKFMQKYGSFTGSGLQEVAKQVADILYHLHVDHQLVWTELKSGNFVLTGDDTLKAIDVESAIPQQSPNVLYTATYAPPEFALEDLCGRNMAMDFSFDIWSYGMLLYEIAMGELYVTTHKMDKNDRVRIFMKLKEEAMRNPQTHLDLGEKLESNPDVPDLLKDLIRQCLSFDPKDRPSIQEVVNHAYFDDYEPIEKLLDDITNKQYDKETLNKLKP